MVNMVYWLDGNVGLCCTSYSFWSQYGFRWRDDVLAIWPIEHGNMTSVYDLLIEAAAANHDKVQKKDIKALEIKYGCTDDTAKAYASLYGIDLQSPGVADWEWSAHVADVDCDDWGGGNSPLSAMIGLAKSLRFKPSKPPMKSFRQLVKEKQESMKKSNIKGVMHVTRVGQVIQQDDKGKPLLVRIVQQDEKVQVKEGDEFITMLIPEKNFL